MNTVCTDPAQKHHKMGCEHGSPQLALGGVVRYKQLQHVEYLVVHILQGAND